MCLLLISVKNNGPEVVKLAEIAKKYRVFKTCACTDQNFQTKGHRDLVIGSNERSQSVDVPFENFGQKHPTGSCQIGQNIQKIASTKVIETWLQAQMKALGPQMCLLTISVKNTRPEIVKLAKIAKNNGFSRVVRDRTFERKVIKTSDILENDFGGVGACSWSLNTCKNELN